jgi:streptogramin lyase
MVGSAGEAQVFDRASGKRLSHFSGLAGATDAIQLPDGAVLVALGAGEIVKLQGQARQTVAKGLKGPTGLTRAPDGTIYVVEAAGGQVSRLDLATGAVTPVATGLTLPKALAVGPKGELVVLETGAKQVVSIDPKSGAKTVVAANLPLGLVTQPLPLAGGLAVGPSGVIYVSSDVDNSILKITR